jgi:hypothetical protein
MTIALKPSTGTPISNTGYDSQNRSELKPSNFYAAIDWLDITFRAVAGSNEAYDLIGYLEDVTGQVMHFSASHSAFNGQTYDGSGRSRDGIMAWYKAPTVDEFGAFVVGSLKLAFPGSVLTEAITQGLLEWFDVIGDDHQVDCTRIDIALDDREKFIKLGKINRARKQGNFFNCKYTELVASSERGHTDAITLYFGARSSDRRLRIYDKTLESKGKVIGNRWEAQFRRKAAGEVFRYWCDAWKRSPNTVSSALARIVLGVIDFRDRGDGDADRHRCEPLKWFQSFIEAVNADPLRLAVKVEEKTMQRSINWVNRSVSSTLAMIKISLGAEFMPYIEKVVSEGGAKLNNLRREIAYLASPHELLY